MGTPGFTGKDHSANIAAYDAMIARVDDISSPGNNQSVQNRFVQLHYLAREATLRNQQVFKAPLNVVAKGTADGAALSWEYESGAATGFNVYRGGIKVNAQLLPGDSRSFADVYDGSTAYTVVAGNADDEDSTPSIAQTCAAGDRGIPVHLNSRRSGPGGQGAAAGWQGV